MRFFLKNYVSPARIPIDVAPDRAGAATEGQTVGMFGDLGNQRLGLFVLDGKVLICLDGRLYEEANQAFVESYDHDGVNRKLVLNLGSHQHIISYKNYSRPVSTPFWTEDEEHVEFGLWFYRVLSSPERRRLLAEGWPNGIP